jgi:hypothetical protein
MMDQTAELRFKCLALAMQGQCSDPVKTAGEFFEFVSQGKHDGEVVAPAPTPRHAYATLG